ncbi:MAG: ATP-binding cassette domain-containing protein [Erysipelothrix sp.]
MIHLSQISKNYKVPIRDGGFKSALKSFVHREYRYIKALDDISFDIPKGQIVGYIGPNGAGKSTTIKIMTGILRPDQGICTIDNISPFTDRKQHAKQIGVVFGQRTQLWWDIPVIDSFELLKDMYDIPLKNYHERLDELTSLLNLDNLLTMPTRQLSLGQRMRCDIAAALLHDPKVLFLDEPTIGLDAPSKVAVRQFIKKINETHKTTVVLTTHDMQDIESLVDRIILIGKGKLLFDGNMDELKKSYPMRKNLKIQYEGTLSPSPHYTIESDTGNYAILMVEGSVQKALTQLNTDLIIQDFEVGSESLDDLILKIYEDYDI